MYFLLLVYVSFAEFTEIKIGEVNKVIKLTKGCNSFRVRSNYQRTSIFFITESESTNTVQYTDIAKEIGCDKICSPSAAICGELKTFKSSELIIGACTSSMYVYIKADSESFITIAATYQEGLCDKIEETLYTKCGSMSYEKCDKCGDNCRIADCIRDRKGKVEASVLTSLCLPYNVSKFEIVERCQRYKDVDLGKWKDDCDESLDIGSVGAGTIIVLVLIMMTFFGFVGLLTWYNWKMKMTGVPPLRCHRFCPDILFPRPKPVRETSNYVPPEINLREFK